MREKPPKDDDELNRKKQRHRDYELMDMPEDEFLMPSEMDEHLARHAAAIEGDDTLSHALDYLEEKDDTSPQEVGEEIQIRQLRRQIGADINRISKLAGIINGFISEQSASGQLDEKTSRELKKFVNFRTKAAQEALSNFAGFDLKKLTQAAKTIKIQLDELEQFMQDEGIAEDLESDEE